ncbi:MAG: T9SS type A sorting domain-containing protein [Flavobacteriales bacterium]|nr:T9SS type A sorting domain-containing protein [Flavobacteriales bacterium]
MKTWSLFIVLIILGSFQLSAQLCKPDFYFLGENAITAKHNKKKSDVGIDYDVVYHRLELNIDPRKSPMNGAVTTYFKPLIDNFQIIKFDLANNMSVDSVIYHNERILAFSHSNHIISILLGTPVIKGSTDSIIVHYSGNPTANADASYVLEKDRPISDAPSVSTLSEPYGAYQWWPCKNGIYDKIDSLDMLVTVPKGNKAAGLGILISTQQPNDSQLIFHWKHRYPVATYLVAVAVTDYVEFTDWVHFVDGDSMPILNYVFPENIDDAKKYTKVVLPIMRYYDSLLGDYPFKNEKYGHAQFMRGGGMEHQTMSFMGSWSFGLIAHELAHQWFGDKITCNSWSDLWLNEGFATYFTLLAREQLQDDKSVFFSELIGSRVKAMLDIESVYRIDTLNRASLFSSRITYNKGAQLLRMLQWQLGDSLFFKSLRNYLSDENLSYNFARTDDLKFHLEATSRKDLTAFFNDWFYGTGNPQYEIIWKQKGKIVELAFVQTTNGDVDFFSIPFEILLSNGHDSAYFTIEPWSNQFTTSVEIGFIADSLQFDPNLWILATATTHNQTQKSTDVFLYPNPAKDEIIVSSFDSTLTQLNLYDITGKVLFEKALSPAKNLLISIPVNHFTNGLYFIELIGTDTKSIAKFVKE